ncbi:MAG: Chorismate mutase and prephenate dehydratase, partial [Candidatus Daviesbacteria bacterium GW2011_GWA1_38_7]
SCCLHLLFGPTITSIQNQKIILNRIKNHRLIGEIKNILEDAGAVIFDMNEVEHDKYMAHIQNLTHFMNISLAKTLLENKVELSGKISTPPFLAQLSALSRIISQPSTLLTEIQLNNSLAIKVLNQYIENQKEIIELIKLKNVETLKKELEKIHQKLDSTPKEKQVRQTKNTEDKKIRLNGKVGYLGPKGTFSHQAALGVVQDNQLTACDSIYQIFEAVSTGRVDFGIVPAENSTEGTIRETLDYLIDLDLKTNGSIDLDIHQNLLSNEQKLDDITSVISHPQALAQCRQWLGNNLPNAKIQTAASTVSSITENKDKKGVAFIGSKLAASLNDIKVLKENIEDNKNNITKFYIISDDIERINFDEIS